jgi:Dyp-type peroxidase family
MSDHQDPFAGEPPAAAKAKAKTVLEGLAAFEAVLPKQVIVPSTGTDFAPEELPEDPAEDVYGPAVRESIQGNIVPGFRKDYQHFLFLRITERDLAKRWLHAIRPSITSMEEALAFVRLHRSMRLRLGVREPGLKATWVNVAFSCGGIEKLLGKGAGSQFGERSFRQGLAARSTYLGDPTDPAHPGHRQRWVVGGPENEADILVIVASDDPGDLERAVLAARKQLGEHRLELFFEQPAATLPGSLEGHEHFGFKDGVSQPGIRGKVSDAGRDFITPRYLVPESPEDRRPRLFARPGQPLVWPGQFLLGEPRQSPEDFFDTRDPASDFPDWARLGSYVVCRRLRQDVLGFWEFAAQAAAQLGTSPERVASMLVGRWQSGAPVMRSSLADDAALAGDDWANNHFLFDDDTRPATLRPIPNHPGDTFPQAKADMLGSVCPHFAHIRKANTRDSATDLGKPADSLTRMILRRGIAFGPPVTGVKDPPAELYEQERGLMFVCYGSTIEDQFEFLCRRWANSPIQPSPGGHDPIIGQRDANGDRTRWIDFPTAAGPVRVNLTQEWVIPTGGGYFFAPPINALLDPLGA